MKLDEIIALTKAGFTKEDIMKLSSSDNTTPKQTAGADPAEAPVKAPEKETKKEPEKKDPERSEVKAEDIGAIISQKFEEAFKPFENLYNQIAIKAQMPTIGNIQPKGIEDIIRDFYE